MQATTRPLSHAHQYLAGHIAAVLFLAYCFVAAPWMKLALLAAIEMTLLFWAMQDSATAPERRASVRFAMKLQARTICQVFFYVYLVGIMCVLVAKAIALLVPIAALSTLLTVPKLHALNGTLFFIAQGVTFLVNQWRMHDLKRSGVSFADFDARIHTSTERVLPAPIQTVRSRLLDYFARLPQVPTRAFSSFFEQEMTLTQVAIDGAPAYQLQWRYCPVKISFTLAESGTGATTLRMTSLRKNWYANLLSNPRTELTVMTYLEAHVVSLLASELALSNAIARQDSLRKQAAESQLRILQAQIEPHFLFNTLANVRHLYRSSTQAGEDMLDHLINYLRYAMHELRADSSTVAREFDLAQHYLAIMKIRMGERLSYSFILSDQVAQHSFPPAMLISLVENALMHGLRDKQDGTLTVSAECEGEHLRLTVLDNGPGLSSVAGSGMGLSNIRQRLEALHGNRAWLEVGAMHTGGFMASIVVPLSEIE
ncbi:MAG: histidine kinase [Pseudomonadota bacterium]